MTIVIQEKEEIAKVIGKSKYTYWNVRSITVSEDITTIVDEQKTHTHTTSCIKLIRF